MSSFRSPVQLISTDFDGTLVEHGNPAPFSPLLVEIFHTLRARGVRWAINTGRSLSSLEEGLESFALPIHPDYVITTEREVFQPATRGRGWEDFGPWNARCARLHDELFAAAAPLLAPVVAFVQKETRAELQYGRRTRRNHGAASELAGIVAQDNAEMDRIVARLDAVRDRMPRFSYQRNSIYLSFCHVDYDKGTAPRRAGAAPRRRRILGVAAIVGLQAIEYHTIYRGLSARFSFRVFRPVGPVGRWRTGARCPIRSYSSLLPNHYVP